MASSKNIHLRPGDLWWKASSILWPADLESDHTRDIGTRRADLSGNESKLVLEMERAKIVGEGRLLATSSNDVIGDMQGLFGVKAPAEHHFLNPKLRIPRRLAGTSFILAGATGPNYYHWLIDCLPRLAIAKHAEIDLDAIDHFLVMNRPPAFVFETLSACGIPASKCVSMHSKEVLECDRLIATELPTPFDRYPDWVIRDLRGLLAPRDHAEPKRLVYLSRKDARGRRVTNEAELVSRLAPMGFEVTTTSGMSVRQQTELFAGAKIIMAPHGAGLTNILFSAPGTTVIEFYDPTYNVDCFQRLGAVLKQKYLRLKCDPADPSSALPPQQQDMLVPVENTVDLATREIGCLDS